MAYCRRNNMQMLHRFGLIFACLYLLKMLMDLADTIHIVRYLSEVLCCTIMTHLNDYEVKVTDFEFLC